MLDAVVFNESGLVPVIAQDVDSERVLMVAWMNREALVETVETGRAVYFSRSRGRLWRKGEQSGHVQHVRGLRLDCDGDVLLMTVEQVGGIACHTGREHCFYRELDMASGEWRSVEPVLRSPESIYATGNGERGATDDDGGTGDGDARPAHRGRGGEADGDGTTGEGDASGRDGTRRADGAPGDDDADGRS